MTSRRCPRDRGGARPAAHPPGGGTARPGTATRRRGDRPGHRGPPPRTGRREQRRLRHAGDRHRGAGEAVALDRARRPHAANAGRRARTACRPRPRRRPRGDRRHFIGAEVAGTAITLGCRVTLVDPLPNPPAGSSADAWATGSSPGTTGRACACGWAAASRPWSIARTGSGSGSTTGRCSAPITYWWGSARRPTWNGWPGRASTSGTASPATGTAAPWAPTTSRRTASRTGRPRTEPPTADRALDLRPGAGQVRRGDPARPRAPAGPR